jgi:alanyl-tRNA synthetase
MALFGEKYASDVRVLSIGDFSMELCGGTHVARAGDIGLFKIISESGVAAGRAAHRGVTGQAAYDWVVANRPGCCAMSRDGARQPRGRRRDKVRELLERSRKLEKEVQQLKSKLASGQGGDLSAQAKDVGGNQGLAAQIDGCRMPSRCAMRSIS